MPLPILLYHQITAAPNHANRVTIAPGEWPYRINKEAFDRQMRWILQQQMRTVPIEQLINKPSPATSEAFLTCQCVCMTFDDGSMNHYDLAYPTLLSYGQRATFFVITDRIGQRGYLSWEQLREMAAHGMSIQSHSCSHSSLRHATRRQARDELLNSKECLEQALGRRVTVFAAPAGTWHSDLSALAQDSGYQIVCTSEQGVNDKPLDLLALKRLSIRGMYSMRRFQSLVVGRPLAILRQQAEAFCFDSAKVLLGWNRYNAIRRYLLAQITRS